MRERQSISTEGQQNPALEDLAANKSSYNFRGYAGQEQQQHQLQAAQQKHQQQ